MSEYFVHSSRTLTSKGSFLNVLVLTTLTAFLTLAVVWFTSVHVTIYAATSHARLEVERENHPVDAPLAGRVISAPPSMGRMVAAGEVILELDAVPESLAQREIEARLAPTASQRASLAEQLRAEQRALDAERQSADAAVAESRAKAERAASSAALASDEASRLAVLRRSGLVSDLEVVRARKRAEEQQTEAHEAELGTQLVARDLHTREQDRVGRIASLKAQIAALDGSRGEALAASNRLGYEITRRQLRAPITGMLAEVSPVRVGSVVAAGDRICTIVPTGELKVVAFFTPSEALGRVRIGQPARIRLEGFPWTQYGSAPARVATIAGEVRDGQVRVDLTLDDASRSTLPLQHGLPAEVDVEIERISPAAMVMRAIGRRMSVNAAAHDPS